MSGSMTGKEHLKALKKEYLRAKHPGFPTEEIDGIVKNTPYTDKTTNGLTKMIVDYVTYLGGYANRINTQGQWNAKLNKYTKSTTKKGTPDLDIILYGTSIRIEVKTSATKDKMRPAQIGVKSQIEKAGGIYYIALDFESTYQYLSTIIKKERAYQ